MQIDVHLDGLGREADGRIGIADLTDHVADDLVDPFARQVGLGRDLAGDDGQVGGHHGFAGDAALVVGRQAVIENGVGNLIGDLVRVAH
jgi:hypothetical protein